MTGITYPFAEALPAPGEAILAAPGVHWIRMPLPFALDHINLWLLEDGDGWTIVDTGFGVEATWSLWDRQFAGTMAGRPVKRIVVTHYHPDHVGSAAWLVERTGAPMHMTTSEYLSAHAAREDTSGFDRTNGLSLWGRHGFDLSRIPEKARTANGYRRGVPELPKSYRRMMDGDVLSIGGRDWKVITVFGHAPEHAALWCESANLLISGDQVLPKITTNVGVWGNQPEANPLKLFLDSLEKFSAVAGDARVLPSHNRVFHGLHERIAELHAHHEERLAKLEEACATPLTAVDALPILFKRALDEHQMAFAMGEAIAHLHWLRAEGRVERIDDAGTYRFVRR